jgi:hypothetical protein
MAKLRMLLLLMLLPAAIFSTPLPPASLTVIPAAHCNAVGDGLKAARVGNGAVFGVQVHVPLLPTVYFCNKKTRYTMPSASPSRSATTAATTFSFERARWVLLRALGVKWAASRTRSPASIQRSHVTACSCFGAAATRARTPGSMSRSIPGLSS